VGVFVGCDPDPAVLAKLTERVEAKKSKDFARSDAIRAELAAMGYQIKDVAGGKVEVRRG
jgi:cysteinyl-tRNA synthetase